MKQHSLLNLTFMIGFKILYRMMYKLFSSVKKHNKNKVVIALYRSKNLDGNLEFVYNEIINQLPNAKIHFVYSENKMNLRLFKEIFIISNARYLIIDDYYLPAYLIVPNKKLKIVQLWHAAGAFKKFGHSTVGTKFGSSKNYLKVIPVHSNYTHVYVSSENVIRFYAEAFNMSPKNIYPLGIPRIDLYNQKQKCQEIKSEIYRDFPMLISEGKVNILLAPTYRAKGSQGESAFNIIESIISVAPLLNNDVCLIFKAHPYMEKEVIDFLNECKNVIIADKHSINDWMLVSDAFITDYSSAVFEFALLKKPIGHFIPDIDIYTKNRGFYESLEKISDGTMLYNNNQLLKWINSRKKNELYDTSRMVNYNFDNTECVTNKIVNHFI